MKRLFLIAILILFTKTKCHVTNLSRTLEVTTRFPKENEMENRTTAKTVNVNKSDTYKISITDNNNRVYLEDVIYVLKNQKWKPEEEACLNQTLKALRSLQNFTLWAVWNWDSISSEPQGLLYGNKYQLGNFDECMNAPWFDTNPELQSQYCLADIKLERSDSTVKKRVDPKFDPYQSALDIIEQRMKNIRPLNELMWGVCVPTSCQPQSVERLLAIMLARSHLGDAGIRPKINISEQCQRADEPREFDGLFYSFIGFIGLLTTLTLFCTYINCNQEENNSSTLKTDVVKAFCLKENSNNLLRMKKEGLEILYGIKFITMTFIVMDHQIAIFNSGPISDGLRTDQRALSIISMFLLHDDLFVDTFFVLSGMLTATTLTSFTTLPNPIFVILRRYIRLVTAMAIVIFYMCAVYPFTGSGPLWLRAIDIDTKPCLKNWWLNILMISNYVDTKHLCIPVSWYIPCDFHFFIIAVFIYWMYKKYPVLGITCAITTTFASIFISGYINYIYDLPAVQLFTYDFVINPRASEQFRLTYITTHTRFAAYAVGFLTGYIFAYYKKLENLNRITQKWAVLGTCASLLIMMVIMVTGSTFLWREYTAIEATVYAALNRPIWALGIATLVLCCVLGSVPLVTAVLSWYPWVPLSRLSYGLYLTHAVFITRNVYVTRNPQHNDYAVLLTSTAGHVVWGCLVAYIIWLLVEAPANNLLSLCLKSKVKRNNFNEETDNFPQSTSSTSVNERNFQNNLPTSIQISSKM